VGWDLNGRAGEDWQKFPYKKNTWEQPAVHSGNGTGH
jgi:hypothetical protein